MYLAQFDFDHDFFVVFQCDFFSWPIKFRSKSIFLKDINSYNIIFLFRYSDLTYNVHNYCVHSLELGTGSTDS